MVTKTKLLGTLVMCMSLLITSCAVDGNDSNGTEPETGNSSTKPNEEVLKSFDIMYPNAKNVNWSTKDSYYVADFTEFSETINSWFELEGNWVLTKATLSPSNSLKSVSQAFSESVYAETYQAKSQSRLERKDFADIYIMEAQNNSQYVNLYYTEKGEYIKAVKHSGYTVDTPVEIPEKVNDVVASLFNSPVILDVWNDQLGPKVGVLDDNVYKIAALDSAYDWISTIWTIEEETIPSTVMYNFKSSPYGANEIEDTRIMENRQDLSYLFYFTESGKHKIASLRENGTYISILTYK